MPPSPRFSTAQLRDALKWLGQQPALLFLFVLALNAVRFPYQGRVHDATLYSFQAMNRLSGGQFSDDLFFRYGSQDRFSAFSTLVSPLVGLAGLEVTFFLLYLGSVALFYWSAIRLTRAITDNDAVVAVTAILIAVTPLWFGGLQIFRSNEAFFTPRLPACALSLLALERALKGRWRLAAVCLAAAIVLHPLMAEGAIFVCLVYGAWELMRHRTTPIKLATVAAAVVIVVAGIGITGRYVPVLDDTWRAIIRQASPYNFPADWDPSDWLTVIGSIAIVSGAAYLTRTRPALSHFLGASVVVAVFGLGLTWFASGSTHSLLFQIQPYRALWLLTALQIPCALLLVASMWKADIDIRRVWVLLLCAYLLRSDLPWVQLQLTLVIVPIAFAFVRLVFPRLPLLETAWRTAAFGAAAGILGLVAMSCVYLVVQRQRLLTEYDPIGYLRIWLAVPGAFVWTAIGCAWLLFMSRRFRGGLTALGGAVACVLVVHTVAVSAPSLRSYQYAFHPEGLRNLDFVESQLARLEHSGRTPTIYMDWGGAGDAWMQFRANNYFHLTQVVGVLFSRQTAVEAARRAAIVAPFEKARYSATAEFNPQIVRLMAERLFGSTVGERSAMALRQLCADPLLDFAILKESTLPADAITNGSIQIYDCRQLRSGLP